MSHERIGRLLRCRKPLTRPAVRLLCLPYAGGGSTAVSYTHLDVYKRQGWVQAVQRIHQLGGMVVLFTARADDVAESAARQWMHAGKNIRELVDGFFSKSHLVLQEKTDGDSIVVPSKDLRFLDESLERVIIVDDNPRRVFQLSLIHI